VGSTRIRLHVERYPEERRGARKEVMLTAAQMAKLLEAIDDAEEEGGNALSCAALRVTFWTGWRIGEVLGLRWSNLDLGVGVARLIQTKTAVAEYRQLPEEAVSVIKSVQRVSGCPFVFPGQDLEGPLTTVKKTWARIRAGAGLHDLDGLGPLRIHDLRHNVVSWDVSRGAPRERTS
jgi:integrase